MRDHPRTYCCFPYSFFFRSHIHSFAYFDLNVFFLYSVQCKIYKMCLLLLDVFAWKNRKMKVHVCLFHSVSFPLEFVMERSAQYTCAAATAVAVAAVFTRNRISSKANVDNKFCAEIVRRTMARLRPCLIHFHSVLRHFSFCLPECFWCVLAYSIEKPQEFEMKNYRTWFFLLSPHQNVCGVLLKAHLP